MIRFAAIAVACSVLALPAFAQSVSEKTGVNSVLGVAPSTADFVQEAALSDMFEIQSSQLAIDKNDMADKSFASQMVTDHTKTSGELKDFVAGGEVQATLPTTLDASHQKMLDTLKGLNGADFTKKYESYQQNGHKDAVSLFKRYAKGGDNAELKAWAQKTLPTLKHHLEMAQNLGG